jgi:5'-3' exonuclease
MVLQACVTRVLTSGDLDSNIAPPKTSMRYHTIKDMNNECMDHICVDCNQIIHRSVEVVERHVKNERVITKEHISLIDEKESKSVADTVVNILKHIFSQLQPKKSFFISIDGPSRRLIKYYQS